MSRTVDRYAALRDRLRRLGMDLALIVTPYDADRVRVRNEATGRDAVYHGNRYDSLADALDTVERLVEGYESEAPA